MTLSSNLTFSQLEEIENNETLKGDEQDISSSDVMFIIRIVISITG